MMKIKTTDIIKKKNKQKITVLTCYDYSFAKILDDSGIDMILVGDSLANVVLGLKETRSISTLEMINHTKAVALGTTKALVVADMPYLSYQKDHSKALANAKKFIKAGSDAVKIEWFSDCKKVIKQLIAKKIPVMGHIGLTPQTAHLLGGYKVQGRDKETAKRLLEQAKILEDLGVFSLVLECLPSELAAKITKMLKIPTIGIGAGKHRDGQVLVLYDLLGLYPGKKAKFVKVYKDISLDIKTAVKSFQQEVKSGKYPDSQHSY